MTNWEKNKGTPVPSPQIRELFWHCPCEARAAKGFSTQGCVVHADPVLTLSLVHAVSGIYQQITSCIYTAQAGSVQEPKAMTRLVARHCTRAAWPAVWR